MYTHICSAIIILGQHCQLTSDQPYNECLSHNTMYIFISETDYLTAPAWRWSPKPSPESTVGHSTIFDACYRSSFWLLIWLCLVLHVCCQFPCEAGREESEGESSHHTAVLLPADSHWYGLLGRQGVCCLNLGNQVHSSVRRGSV